MVPKPTPPASHLPVAFTGARGAYSQRAAARFFGGARPGLTCPNAAEAVRALVAGRASHAVVPIENSITGAFPGVAQAFFEGEIAVVGEVELPIRHCLLAVPGTRLEDLAVVTSHPSALAQCRDLLQSWGVASRPSNDTGQAAQELARGGDRALGVLGSRELAETYGLEILSEGLSDRPDNRTRFFVLGPRGDARPSGLRGAVLIGPLGAPRTLKTLRIQLESRGASRVRVPFLGSEDGTRFLAEFDHRGRDVERVVAEACGSLPFRFLGCWDPPVPSYVAVSGS